MSELIPSKKELVEMVKRKLKEISYRNYYPSELANCEESYKCLYRLNTTILVKVNTCLTRLIEKRCRSIKKITKVSKELQKEYDEVKKEIKKIVERR